VVQEDEREERGRRTILNFGHTIGHAIELAGGFQGHTHGEAISLGMLAATYISQSLKLITSSTSQRIKGLINSVGLPVKVGKISMSKIIKAHYRDKKFIGPKNRFVLIERIGRTKIVHNIPLAVIKDSLLHIGC
jgi:3-dehydroquinate synthetase